MTKINQTIKANQEVHTALAESGEYQKSPHFREENQKKVRRTIEELSAMLEGKGHRQLLDLGCGTGFVIDLCHDLFDEIHGVDVTDAMMKLVNLSPGNIELHCARAENLPFDDMSFDMVTAYSFLDHLDDYSPVLEESYRVLKSGGIFYADLNPNRHFTENLASLEKNPLKPVPPLIQREITGMLDNGAYYEENFGIPAETLTAAEPIKTVAGGLDGEQVARCADTIGFTSLKVEYHWFLGQAHWLHERPDGESEIMESFLMELLPASRPLFKYLRFIFVK